MDDIVIYQHMNGSKQELRIHDSPIRYEGCSINNETVLITLCFASNWNKNKTGRWGSGNCNIVMLPWVLFHNRLMKLFHFLRFTTKMIDIYDCNTCVFVLCKW